MKESCYLQPLETPGWDERLLFLHPYLIFCKYLAICDHVLCHDGLYLVLQSQPDPEKCLITDLGLLIT